MWFLCTFCKRQHMSAFNWLIVSQNITCAVPLQTKTWLNQSEMHYFEKNFSWNQISAICFSNRMKETRGLPTLAAYLLWVKQPYRDSLSNFLDGRYNLLVFWSRGWNRCTNTTNLGNVFVYNCETISFYIRELIIFSLAWNQRMGKMNCKPRQIASPTIFISIKT